MKLTDFEVAINTLSSKAVVNGTPFDSIFHIDGVPLWWFYNRLITTNMLPKLARLQEVYDDYTTLSTPRRHFLYPLRKVLLFLEALKRRSKTLPVPGVKNPIIFFTYTLHHRPQGIYRLDKILPKLTEAVTITAAPFIEKPRLGKDYGAMIYDYMGTEQIKAAKLRAKEMHKLWVGGGRVSLQTTAGGLWPYLQDHCDFLFSDDFLYITFLYYEAVLNIIETEKPALLCITANVGLLEKSVIAAAQQQRIPVLHLQHGFDTDFRKTEMASFSTVKMAVFGKADKELLMEKNIPAERIFVTGGATFDGMEKYISPVVKSVNVRNILLLSQPWVEDGLWNEEQRQQFLDAVQNIGRHYNAQITVKLHPRDTPAVYQGWPFKIMVENIHAQIQQADLIIGVVSTTISESVVLNKPVVVLDLVGLAQDKAYVKKGVVLYGTSASACLEKLPDFLKFFTSKSFAEKRMQYVNDYFYKVDGKAAERIVNVMRKLAQQKRLGNNNL